MKTWSVRLACAIWKITYLNFPGSVDNLRAKYNSGHINRIGPQNMRVYGWKSPRNCSSLWPFSYSVPFNGHRNNNVLAWMLQYIRSICNLKKPVQHNAAWDSNHFTTVTLGVHFDWLRCTFVSSLVRWFVMEFLVQLSSPFATAIGRNSCSLSTLLYFLRWTEITRYCNPKIF